MRKYCYHNFVKLLHIISSSWLIDHIFRIYRYNRAEVIRSFGWMVDMVLPEELQEKLSDPEKEYFKNHSAALQSYISESDVHLTVVINSVYTTATHYKYAI